MRSYRRGNVRGVESACAGYQFIPLGLSAEEELILGENTFEGEQSLFGFDAACISAEFHLGAGGENSVTGDNERNRIIVERVAYRASCLRAPDTLRDLAVG